MSPRILIITGNTNNGNIFREIFNRSEFEACVHAMNMEVIGKITTSDYRALVFDEASPGEIADILHTIRRRKDILYIPVLYLSSDARPESKARILDCGADAYITKPLHTQELIANIKALDRICSKCRAEVTLSR